jgi:hypothetical protein
VEIKALLAVYDMRQEKGIHKLINAMHFVTTLSSFPLL